MSLTQTDIAKISKLAKLSLNEKTETELLKDFAKILEFVDQIHAVGNQGHNPSFHTTDGVAILREDRVTEIDDSDRFQKCAPKTQAGQYLVPKVIE